MPFDNSPSIETKVSSGSPEDVEQLLHVLDQEAEEVFFEAIKQLGGGKDGTELLQSRLEQAQFDISGLPNLLENQPEEHRTAFFTALKRLSLADQRDVDAMQESVKQLKLAGNVLQGELPYETFIAKFSPEVREDKAA